MITLLKKATDAKRFDVRVVEKNISRGQLANKDLDSHVNSLPDDEAQCEWVDTSTLSDSDSGSSRSHFGKSVSNGDGSHKASSSSHSSEYF